MSLIPVFEIGLWNAWIFILYDLLTIPFFLRIAKSKGASTPESDLSRIEKIVLNSSKVIYIPAAIYSIFLPLKLGTMWFYIGLPITLLGLITGTIVLVNWATTPPGVPITRGLYRYSRHPMYVTSFMFLLGVSVASASWVFLLYAIVVAVISFVFAKAEERGCLEQYGDAYREYMSRTPRYIGVPKSGQK